MQPTERFSSRADHYARYRPDYPAAAVALLAARCGLRPGTVVAELGSGTGILTRHLLARGAQVLAVEPNQAMRATAEAALQGEPGFHSVPGSAEATTLAAASVDLIVAAQAFHWFDVERARAEALRVVRPGGWAALLWNERVRAGDPFMDDYEKLLREHAAEYAAITASRADEPAMRRFLGGEMQAAYFPNAQRLDLAGLWGRVQSASYAPEPGSAQYEPLQRGLAQLFARHAREGCVRYPYETRVYFAPLR